MDVSDSMGGGTRDARRSILSRFGALIVRHQWLILGALGILGGVLGYVGHLQLYARMRPPSPTHPVDLIYQTIQLVWFNSYQAPSGIPWALRAARFIIPAVVLFAAIKGLLVLFYSQAQWLRARRCRGHSIVCGLGRKGMFITRRLRSRGEVVVVVERNPSHQDLAAARDIGAVVVTGDATQAETLRRVRVDRARRLVTTSGDDNTNVAIAATARDLAVAEGGALVCVVHIGDLDLFEALAEQRFQASEAHTFWFELFNVYDAAARAALGAYPPFDPTPGAAPAEPAPHIVVTGHGALARSVIVHAARRWQTARADDGARLRVTIFDDAAAGVIERLIARWVHVSEVCEFVSHAACRGVTGAAAFLADGSGPPISAVYVCSADSEADWPAALTFEQLLRRNRVPVVLFASESKGVASLVQKESSSKSGTALHVIPTLEVACDPDFLFGGLQDELARAIHEEYVRGERAKPAGERTKSDDDRAMRPWSELDDDLRDQNRAQAADIRSKLEAVGCDLASTAGWVEPTCAFTDEEVERLAQLEHERWMGFKAAQGWTWGSELEKDAKRHPDMKPWSDLDEPTRDKDRTPVRLIPTLVDMAGYRVVRQSPGQ